MKDLTIIVDWVSRKIQFYFNLFTFLVASHSFAGGITSCSAISSREYWDDSNLGDDQVEEAFTKAQTSTTAHKFGTQ